ncbi:MAG: HU family DNA-binding protein, partial [Endomicrobium sp.]|nr:HU family DNA-binding protein [Endomicrobium sp.]
MKDSKLTKAEIIENVYERTKHDKKDIHEIFDIILNVIKEGLCDNRIVELRGFGTFE